MGRGGGPVRRDPPASPAIRASFPSPFDYAEQSRAYIINDVAHDDPAALAGAYRTLFMRRAAGRWGCSPPYHG